MPQDYVTPQNQILVLINDLFLTLVVINVKKKPLFNICELRQNCIPFHPNKASQSLHKIWSRRGFMETRGCLDTEVLQRAENTAGGEGKQILQSRTKPMKLESEDFKPGTRNGQWQSTTKYKPDKGVTAEASYEAHRHWCLINFLYMSVARSRIQVAGDSLQSCCSISTG